MKNGRFQLLFLSLACAACATPADLIVVNANILTVDREFHHASALAVRDGVFAFVGTDAGVGALAGPSTRRIDARGGTIVPGLIESHVHAQRVARAEVQQPFVQLHSIGEIQEWVRQRAVALPAGTWIRLPRVDVTRIRERRIPTRTDLDAAAPSHPAVFTWEYANRTVQVLNSAALSAAGIDAQTEPPAGGRIRFGDDGQPTGVLENCGGLVATLAPSAAVSDQELRDSLVALLHRYNAIGITSIGERFASLDELRTYQALARESRLTTRVNVTVKLDTDGTEAGTERAIRALPFKTGDGDDWVRVGPLKFRVDGGALYGTAFLREPYGPRAFALYGISDPDYRGDLLIGREQLTNIIRTGHRLGWQMASHVTGDAGVDAVLDALEAADADSPVSPRRFNLIHGYFSNEGAARRAAKLGVCLDTQPAYYFEDADALAPALGEARVARYIGLQTWLRAGVNVALNADHMFGVDPDTSLNPYNPFLAIQTAVSRLTQGGLIFGADQRVSREDALRMVTINAARMTFDEARKGSIEAGKLADFALLTADPLRCPEAEIRNIRALMTVVGGKVVYERADRPGEIAP